MTTIDQNRLAEITSLAVGSHASPADGLCLMEAVAYVAGEPHSEHPECACPVISIFLRVWNDALPDNMRSQLLIPLIPEIIGTKASLEVELRRKMMALDWAVRSHLPPWLWLAGLRDMADKIGRLSVITSLEELNRASDLLKAADTAAWDAVKTSIMLQRWGALDMVAKAAIRLTGGASAWMVAYDAGVTRPHPIFVDAADAAQAARAATASSAWIGAQTASDEDFAFTIAGLQLSARRLVREMIAAGETTTT